MLEYSDMAENLTIVSGTKEERYQSLLPQLFALMEGETDRIANLANCSAALKEAFGFFWVGFYVVKDNQLVLGPFQGPIACTRIAFDKGVCGKSWATGESIVVPDVEAFPGHIACSSLSKSEIVVPVFNNEKVVAVLDVNSDALAAFDETDNHFLSKLCAWIGENW